VAVIVVALTVEAVVAPIEVLLMVEAAVGFTVNAPAGLIVTVPVPVGLMAMFALAGLRVTVELAVNVVAETVPPDWLVDVLAEMDELQENPVFVVHVSALVAPEQLGIENAAKFAVPLVAFASTVLVAV